MKNENKKKPFPLFIVLFLILGFLFLVFLCAIPAQASTNLFLRQTVQSDIAGYYDLELTRGTGVKTGVVNTTAGGTGTQWTETAGGTNIAWISRPFSSGGATIAGAVTLNLWAFESNDLANAGARITFHKYSGGVEGTAIGTFNKGAEFATSAARVNWSGTPTSTVFAAGDRLVVKLWITNQGTMAGGYNCTLDYDGTTGSADGDTYVTLAETVVFDGNVLYVDTVSGNDSNSGANFAQAWATIQHAIDMVKAGDTVNISAGVYAEGLDTSAALAGTSGEHITFQGMRNGDVIVRPSTDINALKQASRAYWDWKYIIFDGANLDTKSIIAENSASNCTFTYCVIRGGNIGTASGGLIVNSASGMVAYNVTIAGVQGTGLEPGGDITASTVRNTIISGAQNGYGISIGSGNTLDWDYNLVFGNNANPTFNTDLRGTIIDGGHNIITNGPDFVSYPIGKTFLSMGVDDVWSQHAHDTAVAVAAVGGKININVITNRPATLSNIADLNDLYADGHAINTHSYSHVQMTVVNAFTVHYTGAAATCTVTVSGNMLTLDSSTDAEDHTLNLTAVAYDTVAEVQAAINGFPNYAAVLGTGLSPASTFDTKSINLADVTAQDIKTTYQMLLDTTRVVTNELNDSVAWLEANIAGLDVKALVYPGGTLAPQNATVESLVQGNANAIQGARGTDYRIYKLPSVDIYHLDASHTTSDLNGVTEVTTRLYARHVAEWCKARGGANSFYTHYDSDESPTNIGYTVSEWLQYPGITYMLDQDIYANIRADHSTVDGLTYSKTYPDVSDFRLLDNSPAIDAGTDVGLTTDILGNPIYGPPDIGAYEYQPPYTMGTDGVPTTAAIRVYGDEKFRNKATPSDANIADLSITIPDTDKTQWLDAEISIWDNTGVRHKVWTASSTVSGLTNTVHTIGDLEANKYYNVKVDDVLGADITGADCANGVCKADSSGKITFTYTGTYSDHIFDVQEFVVVVPGGGSVYGYSNPPIPGPNGFRCIINNNDASTNNREVNLTLEAGENVKYVAISENKDLSGAGFESFVPEIFSKKFTLSAGDGLKRVYAQFLTAYNRFSDIVYDEIILDTSSSAKQEEQPKPEIPTIVDGDLIRAINTFDVYIVKLIPAGAGQAAKKFKRLILNPDIFNQYKHLKWENVKEVNQEILNQYITSDLVRALGDIKVYKLYANGDIGEKRWIKTLEDFISFAYDWDSVYTINNYERNSYTNGVDLIY